MVVQVSVARPRWSREFASCRGWGAGDDTRPCDNPDGAEFAAGRCYRCHVAHARWEARRQSAALPPALLGSPPALPDPEPEAAPPDPPAPAIVPRDWTKHYDRCVQCRRTDRPHRACGLCTDCYPASLKSHYTGRKGPTLSRAMNEAEQRAVVDAYLATIDAAPPVAPDPAPDPAPPPAPPAVEPERVAAFVADMAPILAAVDPESPPDPAPVPTPPPVDPPVDPAPEPAPDLSGAAVAELRDLLDRLAVERAATLEEERRIARRRLTLDDQCRAVETTLALLAGQP